MKTFALLKTYEQLLSEGKITVTFGAPGGWGLPDVKNALASQMGKMIKVTMTDQSTPNVVYSEEYDVMIKDSYIQRYVNKEEDPEYFL